ncbi:CaiB/BaiF CoA transferase family protein [Brevibacillus ginsengisoli]|uniref:CaiB/BaiF CoA transferase family protein n=1 Tax=Brevibacillus ginsengisoli TaxID=363854 RepID=UPI003CEB4E8E
MLSGVTVVDFSRYLPGPICTLRLADMGAEIIKVEAYPTGHLGRQSGPFTVDGRVSDLLTNRNKHSVAIDLRTAEGRELAFDLAVRADVVVESFRPGVMEHLGLDYDSLIAVKPDLIYCSLTGYGQSGVMHQLGGHDLNYQAVSGFLSLTRDSDGKPVISEIPIADYVGGLYAAEQICAALVQRSVKRQGAYLDIASCDLLASWMDMHSILAEWGKRTSADYCLSDLISYNIYETADSRYVALAALEDKFWQNFCRAIGRMDLETIPDRSMSRHPEIYEELKALFLTRTQAEWNELGMEVDCCLTVVEELDSWSEGLFITTRPFVSSTMSKSPLPYGADTHRILRKKLGCTDRQLAHYENLQIIPKER